MKGPFPSHFHSVRIDDRDDVRFNGRMKKYMTASQARKNFYSIVHKAGRPGDHVVIVHKGVPKAVCISFEEFESWKEAVGSHQQKARKK